MKIWVPVKRVPDTAARIRLARNGRSIETGDVKFVLNPHDEFALEESLLLREKAGQGEVAVISVGSKDAAGILRQALAMGADRAVLLEADAPVGTELDGYQVGTALANYLKDQEFDLIFLGRLAVDLQSGAMGSFVAGRLGIPRVCDVIRLDWNGECFRAHHVVRGAVEVVEVRGPAVFTAPKGLNEPRYPALKGILAAKKKPLETIQAALPGPVLELNQLEPPPTRKPGRIVGEGPGAVAELIRLLKTEAKIL